MTDDPCSFVYYLRKNGLIKIGRSGDLRSRMRQLCPDALLAIEPGGRTLEAERHRQFEWCNMPAHADGREWFAPEPELLAHIAAIAAITAPLDPKRLPTRRQVTIAHAAMTDDPLVTVQKAARALGVSSSTIYSYVRDGMVVPHSVTPGGHLRFRARQLAGEVAELAEVTAPDRRGEAPR